MSSEVYGGRYKTEDTFETEFPFANCSVFLAEQTRAENKTAQTYDPGASGLWPLRPPETLAAQSEADRSDEVSPIVKAPSPRRELCHGRDVRPDG